MTDLDRAVVRWSGFVGAPGFSIWHALPGGSVAAALRDFYFDIRLYIPSTVSIDVPDSGDTIDDATGAITGSWSSAANPVVTCTGSGNYSAASGGLVQLRANAIIEGRRLRGRSFLVPLIGGAYDAAGQLGGAAKSAIGAALNGLVADSADHLVVWSRPTTGRAGSHGIVTSAEISPKVTVLRSRRD